MIKSSLKTLYVAFLILFIGSANSMDDDDDVVDDTVARATADRTLNVRILRALSDRVSDDLPFAEAVLNARSVGEVNGFLKTFKDWPLTKRESALTAIIVQAVKFLKEADARDPRSKLVAVRLASFLLGNRLLAPVYAWLDDDVKRIRYFRGLESIEGRTADERGFLLSFSGGFIEGAKVFGRTYEDFRQFIVAQQEIDAARDGGSIFGDAMLMPGVWYILNEAVRAEWESIDADHDEIGYDAETRERRSSQVAVGADRDAGSAIGSTATGVTIAPTAVFSLLVKELSAEANSFAERLFVNHDAGGVDTVDDLLRTFSTARDKETILTAVITKAVIILRETNPETCAQAWWVTARLASFLLGNRLLPPFHGWLDEISLVALDESEPENVQKLKYLMDPADGMLCVAMRNLAGRVPPTRSESTTDIVDLTKRFARASIEFYQTYSDVARITQTQRRLDVIGFGKDRVMPNMLQIFSMAMQKTDAQIREEGERRSQLSPLRAARNTTVVSMLPSGQSIPSRVTDGREPLPILHGSVNRGGDASVGSLPPAQVMMTGKMPGTGTRIQSPLLGDNSGDESEVEAGYCWPFSLCCGPKKRR